MNEQIESVLKRVRDVLQYVDAEGGSCEIDLLACGPPVPTIALSDNGVWKYPGVGAILIKIKYKEKTP